MNHIKLDPLRLQFPEGLEQAFRDDHFRKSLKPLRISIVLGTALYALFGILDAMIFPVLKIDTWLIRYAVVCPVCIFVLLFTYSQHFKKYMQVSIAFAVIICGAGIISMMVIVNSPMNYFHFAGLLLVFMYTYTFSKLRFIYTTLASWIIVLMYEIAAVRIMQLPLLVLLNDNLFYFAVNLIGMFSCYQREVYIRKGFLQTLVIKDLEEAKHRREKEKIFRDLHDGIGGITTNIGMLSEVALMAKSEDEVERALLVISELSREGMMEIRNIMHSFDAARKTWQTIAAELRRQGSAMIEPHAIAFDMTTAIEDDHDQPDNFLCLNLFRIYKEALMNVVKHSSAKTVNVDLKLTVKSLILSVSDDGIGIGKEGIPGRGIVNMKARAKEVGGKVDIISVMGTTIRLELPRTLQYSM